jgi:molybdate transport system substrate-binding protein
MRARSAACSATEAARPLIPRVRVRSVRGRACLAIVLGTLCVFALLPAGARADTVHVLAAGAVQGGLRQIESAFKATTGHTIDGSYDTVGALRDRVLAGDRADVVFLSEAGMAALHKAGKLANDPPVIVGSISVALAVRRGTPLPEAITTPDALKRVLLAARSIAHADPARGATAGVHFARVLEQLGIAEEVKPRLTVLSFGGDVIKGVAAGRFEIGASQSSEIKTHPGVTLLGSLPPPYALKTVYMAAKVAGAGTGADALLAFLGSPGAKAAFAGLGFDPP